MNIYKEILKQNLPRLLCLYNLDPCSSAYGCGDRLHWGWKISDFSNGTMQGGVHALSIGHKLGLIENEVYILNAIDAVIMAIGNIRGRNGSLVEAYPGENSLCVTAQVAFDVLSAINHLQNHLRDDQKLAYLDIVRPLITFITRHNEDHAIISNHLATAAAAILLWNTLTGETSDRFFEFLNLIYKSQSEEGWYQEYEGADPGYQTLCTYYLLSIFEITQDEKLLESLHKSAAFLKYFVHPDGTIGGVYGSRNTEVYYPGGIVGLAPFVNDFAIIARGLQEGIVNQNHILPHSIDIGNFIPLLNAYAVAAVYYDHCREVIQNAQEPPAYKDQFVINFKDCGLYLHSTSKYYAIVNYKKGGTLKVFDKKLEQIDIEDGGVFGRLENGTNFSTQQFDPQIQFDDLTIEANFYALNEKYPSPFKSIILRIFSLTIFRFVAIGNIFKKYIVKLLITGKKKIGGQTLRQFEFKDDTIIIHEKISSSIPTVHIGHLGKCKAIHMASSGYYLRQIEQVPELSKIVEFRSQFPKPFKRLH